VELLFALALSVFGATPGLTKLPKLVHYVEAPYPEEALAAKKEGSVILQIDIDAEGEVQRVEVKDSTSPEFEAPALAAACNFVFEPAEAGDKGKVPVRITYRYAFVLKAPAIAETSTKAKTSSTAPPEVVRRPRGPVNFHGTIKEAGTRKPIGYATITVSISTTSTTTRSSTEADERGRFAFRGLPPGKHVITVRAPLFERFDTKEEIREKEALEVIYYVTREKRNPYEVVVHGEIEKKEVARRTLHFEDVERLPGTQGDAIRVIQNLPGVARTPFGIGLLVVRGAPPQDTGVFMDGWRLPILFHFGGIGGLTSVVNARMLEAIDFYPGGFGPGEGRVSAGIVELRSKYAETDRVHGEAQVDIAGAQLFLEGPVTKDENDGAFVLALRRSYIDGVLAGITSAVDSSIAIAPRYWDYQARYDKPLGSRSRMLTLLAYGSDDEFVLVGSARAAAGTPSGTESRTYFHRFNPRFQYTNEETKLTISPIIGVDYSNLSTIGDPSGNNLNILIEDWTAGVRVDGVTRFDKAIKLRAGGDLVYYRFDSDSTLPAFPRVKAFPSPIPTDVPPRTDRSQVPAILSSVYGELELEPLDNLYLYPGLRLDIYEFYANPQPLIDPRLVEGRTFTGLDPRLSARYRVRPDLWLKGQAGVYRQPPLPPELYLNADLPLQTVDQYSVGTEWDIVERLSLDVQGFLRLGYGVPRATADVETVNGVIRPIGFAGDGRLRSYGLEVLLKLEKRWGLFGWIAYTLSRAETKPPDGDWRPNLVTDQTHNLNIVASYDLGLNWFVSMRFRYVTGGGLPKTLDRWFDADRDGYVRDLSTDLLRAPAFHQLDLRVDHRWVFDEWYLEAYLDVQNVYNAKNTEVYIPSFDFKSNIAIPSLPIFPIFGVKGVF
jgi:TonB family protein